MTLSRVVLAGAVLLLGGVAPAWAGPPVDVALVLVADVSRSIDDVEFQLQKEGYRAAFTNPRVLQAIRSGAVGTIAVSYLEFAGAGEVRVVVDWTEIKDDESATIFADQLVKAPRSFYGRTAISAGVDLAVQRLAAAGFQTSRPVIDVSGDGTNNAGRDITAARDAALAAGITINGLTIINDHPASYSYAHTQPPGGLTKYYRDNVAGGPGSFVLEVRDFTSFGDAMTRKLINEIAEADRPGAPPPM